MSPKLISNKSVIITSKSSAVINFICFFEKKINPPHDTVDGIKGISVGIKLIK